MAINIGRDGSVLVGASSAATAVGSLRSFSIEETADTIETTKMGDTARSYVKGFTSGTVSIEAYWDEMDAGQLLFDIGDTLFFKVMPNGAGDGTDQIDTKLYSGTGVVTSKSINTPFDGVIEASFQIQVNGSITESQL